MARSVRKTIVGGVCILAVAGAFTANAAERKLAPEVDGEWWQVAGDPDLGKYTTPGQQPVDFGVWQAADGTWQLWSCIRKTDCGGNTRLFYGWEGKQLTDKNWTPMGIKMEADPDFGETPGGLQAPHVVKTGDTYNMFYGDWEHICRATSKDGKTFERVLYSNGIAGMFTEGRGCNTRDAMALKVGDLWHCYYTAYPNDKGYVFCRTSKDLLIWSPSKIVAYGGRAGTYRYTAECPHVVYIDGYYYLWRTQRYGKNMQTSVYRSKDPMDFGIDDDRYFVKTMEVAAPEIILHDGQYYIASLMRSLKGIKIAKLKWTEAE